MKTWITVTALLCAGLTVVGCLPRTAPDLAVDRIEFTMVNRTGANTGRVRITGHIMNIGTDFRSGPGQQSLQLFEVVPGGAERMVARRNFQTLLRGESLSVSYERNWNRTMMAEFPPDYRLVIAMDPDILIDGNDDNNDSNFDNHELTESGHAINDLFTEIE